MFENSQNSSALHPLTPREPHPSLSTFPGSAPPTLAQPTSSDSAPFPHPYPKSRLNLQSGILELCPSTKKGPASLALLLWARLHLRS